MGGGAVDPVGVAAVAGNNAAGYGGGGSGSTGYNGAGATAGSGDQGFAYIIEFVNL